MPTITRANHVPTARNQAPATSDYVPRWPTAKGRAYAGKCKPGEGRKRLHRRRQLTAAERLRICEEYLAGYERARIIDRWDLANQRALTDIVSRLMSSTARKIRQDAKINRMNHE